MISKLSILTTIIMFFSLSANAVSLRTNATVEILDPATFSAESEIETFEVSKSQNVIKEGVVKLVKKKGDAFYVQELPESEYRIAIQQKNIIQLGVVSQNGDTGVMVDDFTLSYNGVPVSKEKIVYGVSGKSDKIKVSANLKVQEKARSGFHKPSFDIAVYYE